MNSVILTGRLTADPEVGYTQSQKAVCKFTLAVGRAKEGADFIRIVVWDKQGENVGKYLHKGSKCAVNGSIQTGSYKDREGKTVYTTDVVANPYRGVEFLDSKPAPSTQPVAFDDMPDSFTQAEDDLPF